MRVSIKYKAVSWESLAALTCFASSVTALGLGFIFTTGWLLNADRHPALHTFGITLLIVGIPILILGGHCLDLIERKSKRAERN